MDSTSNVRGVPPYIAATGGTPCMEQLLCTDYKVHTFTGPGTFTVYRNAGTPAGSNTVAYMVVAGGRRWRWTEGGCWRRWLLEDLEKDLQLQRVLMLQLLL